MGFGESAKMGRRGVFCDVYHAPLLPLSLDRFPPNFPRTRVQVVARDTSFHVPERFPLRGRISRKTVFFQGTLGYPVCAQPTGHGKRSATPTLFPSKGGHPTDLSFLGDFCWGMYRFPAIHVRKFPFATVSALDAYISFKHTRQGRHHRITDLQWYLLIHCTSSFISCDSKLNRISTQTPRTPLLPKPFTENVAGKQFKFP